MGFAIIMGFGLACGRGRFQPPGPSRSIVRYGWQSREGHYPVAAYQTAFGLCLAFQAAALLWFCMPWIRTFGRNVFGELVWKPR